MNDDSGPSIPLRLLCAVAALASGYTAVQIALTGEMHIKSTVYELSPLMRCIPVGVLGLLSAVAAYVAITGRE